MARWMVMWLWLWPGVALAEGPSLFSSSGPTAPVIGGARAQIVSMAGTGGLFAAGPAVGLFAALPDRGATGGGTPIALLFDLIASAEAGAAGYDAVQHGARLRPPLPPTRMTVGEILDWIAATPGQPHAIGRYQFIPATLRRLMRDQGIGRDDRFSPDLQDRLALQLLREAGLDGFHGGTLGRRGFMENLARVWAGLPLASNRSFYHGQAGNRSVLTWAEFDQRMQAIFPDSRA